MASPDAAALFDHISNKFCSHVLGISVGELALNLGWRCVFALFGLVSHLSLCSLATHPGKAFEP